MEEIEGMFSSPENSPTVASTNGFANDTILHSEDMETGGSMFTFASQQFPVFIVSGTYSHKSQYQVVVFQNLQICYRLDGARATRLFSLRVLDRPSKLT